MAFRGIDRGHFHSFFGLLAAIAWFAPEYTEAAPAAGSSTLSGVLRKEIPAPPSGRKLGFSFEMRPSSVTHKEEFHTENAIDVSYTLNPLLMLHANQSFNIHVFDSGPSSMGFAIKPFQLYLGVKFSQVFHTQDHWSLNIEPRVYIPEQQVEFNAQKFIELRSIFTLAKVFNPSYTFALVDIPILRGHAVAGTTAWSKEGAFVSTPNNTFENRFAIVNSFTFGRVSLSVPIFLVSTYMHSYREKEGGFKHFIAAWPEVRVDLGGGTAIGAAVRTDPIWTNKGFNFFGPGGGFTQATYQLILSQKI